METVVVHTLKKCCLTAILDVPEDIILWKNMNYNESKLKRDSENLNSKYVKKF